MLSLYYNYQAKKLLKEVNKTISMMAPEPPVALLAQRDMLQYEIEHHTEESSKFLFFILKCVVLVILLTLIIEVL
jgi:hypothetical protein